MELPSLRLDSQAKYGALSRGDASIFMRFPDPTYREKIWDHCAGVSIIQARWAVDRLRSWHYCSASHPRGMRTPNAMPHRGVLPAASCGASPPCPSPSWHL